MRLLKHKSIFKKKGKMETNNKYHLDSSISNIEYRGIQNKEDAVALLLEMVEMASASKLSKVLMTLPKLAYVKSDGSFSIGHISEIGKSGFYVLDIDGFEYHSTLEAFTIESIILIISEVNKYKNI
jgi:hypothetical protein